MPDDPFPEVGQCVHKLLVHPARPERLWQQNHCGVYRSDDRGDNWERLEGNGLPSGFGFPIALDPSDPDAAYVVPEEGAENRVTPNGRLGDLPHARRGRVVGPPHGTDCRRARWAVREARGHVASNGSTRSASTSARRAARSSRLADGGETWVEAARFLPAILSVEAAEWS